MVFCIFKLLHMCKYNLNYYANTRLYIFTNEFCDFKFCTKIQITSILKYLKM